MRPRPTEHSWTPCHRPSPQASYSDRRTIRPIFPSGKPRTARRRPTHNEHVGGPSVAVAKPRFGNLRMQLRFPGAAAGDLAAGTADIGTDCPRSCISHPELMRTRDFSRHLLRRPDQRARNVASDDIRMYHGCTLSCDTRSAVTASVNCSG